MTCVLEDVQSGPGRKAEWKVFQAGGTVCVKAQRPKRHGGFGGNCKGSAVCSWCEGISVRLAYKELGPPRRRLMEGK